MKRSDIGGHHGYETAVGGAEDRAMPGGRGPWVLHGEETVWSSEWLDLAVADVSSPTGRRLQYEVVRAHYQGAAGLVVDHADRVLLIHRHRFITDSWGWELPAGGLMPGETPTTAAIREVDEEVGWQTYDPRLVWSLARCPERSSHIGHLVWLRAGERLRPPDPEEVARVEWFTRGDIQGLLAERQITDVFTVAGLLWWLTT